MKNLTHHNLKGSIDLQEKNHNEMIASTSLQLFKTDPINHRNLLSAPFRKISYEMSSTNQNKFIETTLHRSNSMIRFNNISNGTSSSSSTKTSTDQTLFNYFDISNTFDDSSDDEERISYGSHLNLNSKDLTILMPFNHQVGGHTQLLLLNQHTLCKPLIPRELFFYLNIPDQIKSFVPSYKGVVEICQNESSQPTLYHPIKSLVKKKPEFRVRLSSISNDRDLLESPNLAMEKQSRPIQQYFMLLENIASKFHMPCVLDLKMGTRQHSDDASDEKRHRQIAKCRNSTSATLGLRICGMQVYHRLADRKDQKNKQIKINNYKIYQKDKYHGRNLKQESEFKHELEMYFYQRTYLIRPIISRLKKLKAKVIETMRTTPLRFLATSLLIVTEGCHELHESRLRKASHYSDGEDDFYDDDEEFDEFEEDFSSPEIDYNNENNNNNNNTNLVIDDEESFSSSSLDSMSDDLIDENLIKNNEQENNYSCPLDHRHRTLSSSTEFDIRLIDFAHTSFTSTTSATSDYGFIMGIDNLIRLLNEILFDEMRLWMSMASTNNLNNTDSNQNNHHHNQNNININININKQQTKSQQKHYNYNQQQQQQNQNQQSRTIKNVNSPIGMKRRRSSSINIDQFNHVTLNFNYKNKKSSSQEREQEIDVDDCGLVVDDCDDDFEQE